MQLHQAQEMHHQLVNQQHMIHQQGLYVQQYSYAVPEFPQQFPQPAFYMPPPPPQQMGWDGGGHQPRGRGAAGSACQWSRRPRAARGAPTKAGAANRGTVRHYNTSIGIAIIILVTER